MSSRCGSAYALGEDDELIGHWRAGPWRGDGEELHQRLWEEAGKRTGNQGL